MGGKSGSTSSEIVLLKYLKRYCALHLYNRFMSVISGNNKLEVVHGSFLLVYREDFVKVRMIKYKRLPAETMESPLLGNI